MVPTPGPALRHWLRRGLKFSLILAVAAISLSGCRAEYHGWDSGIDGVLWRQIASFEDPLSRNIYQPLASGPSDYLAGIEGARWSGSGSVDDMDLRNGGVVIYDVSSTDSTAAFSVFIASGPRPDVPTDDGKHYYGPSAVFTCYGIEAQFRPPAEPSFDRIIFTECSPTLVNLMPKDAAFASGEVFDG